MKRKMLSLLLVLCMLLSLIPMAASAAIYESPLNNATFLRNNDAGSITKQVGETGRYQRLPRLTDKHGNHIAREFIPDDYYGVKVELSNPDVLSDCKFTMDTWTGGQGYNGYPCFNFTYKAAQPGTTNVKLTFYYQYDAPAQTGYCACGNRISCPANYNHYYETTTFTVTVPAVEETLTLSYDANGGDGAPTAESKKTTTGSAEFTVSQAVPTKDDSDFLGWAETADAATAAHNGGDSITISQNTTLYAVWTAHEHGSNCPDDDEDGFCDKDENQCLHEKNEDDYCTVEDCTHGICCPKPGMDKDGDGFEDITKECLHTKDEDDYCIEENCDHDEDCCPKDPDTNDDGFHDETEECLHEKVDGYCVKENCDHSNECCPKNPDSDNDGFHDETEECLHTKDESGYCTVEGCNHGTCCPKPGMDKDDDGFEDITKECLHTKDDEDYCTEEDCNHDEDCCPKPEPEIVAPDGPTAQKIWDSSYAGYHVTVTCPKNSYHTVKIGIKNFNDGLVIGEVLPNEGSNASRYPWVCYVEPNGEYFTEIAKNNGIDMNRFDHYATEVEGMTFYGTEDGEYWFADSGNTMYVYVAHD